MKEKYKILLLEDDKNLGFVIKDLLESHGYHVDHYLDGKTGLQKAVSGVFDLYLLDVMMPGTDGFSIATELRKTGIQSPVIFLTARGLKEDRIKGFQVGGDDYITKPFAMEELVLRIEAVLRRSLPSKKTDAEKDLYGIGTFVFNYKDLSLDNGLINRKLTKKEADVLRILCSNVNEVITRDKLLVMVWGDDDYFKGRSLDVYITKLRKYLKDDQSIHINNLHGTGFKLEVKG